MNQIIPILDSLKELAIPFLLAVIFLQNRRILRKLKGGWTVPHMRVYNEQLYAENRGRVHVPDLDKKVFPIFVGKSATTTNGD